MRMSREGRVTEQLSLIRLGMWPKNGMILIIEVFLKKRGCLSPTWGFSAWGVPQQEQKPIELWRPVGLR